MGHSTQSGIARQFSITRITKSKASRNYLDISAGTKRSVPAVAKNVGCIPTITAQSQNDIGTAGFRFIETAQTFSTSLSIINQDPCVTGTTAALVINEIEAVPRNDSVKKIILEEEFFRNDSNF